LVRLGDEPARDRVAVHVAKLLDVFGFGVDVEVIVATLPEGPLPALDSNRELERLKRLGQEDAAGFTDQQMHVLGHDNVAGDEELVPDAHGFQRALEEVPGGGCAEVRETAVTGERDEVEVVGPLNPDEAPWHGGMVHPEI
jgi:hypothetical protein